MEVSINRWLHVGPVHFSLSLIFILYLMLQYDGNGMLWLWRLLIFLLKVFHGWQHKCSLTMTAAYPGDSTISWKDLSKECFIIVWYSKWMARILLWCSFPNKFVAAVVTRLTCYVTDIIWLTVHYNSNVFSLFLLCLPGRKPYLQECCYDSGQPQIWRQMMELEKHCMQIYL